jgi:hypothetical protein
LSSCPLHRLRHGVSDGNHAVLRFAPALPCTVVDDALGTLPRCGNAPWRLGCAIACENCARRRRPRGPTTIPTSRRSLRVISRVFHRPPFSLLASTRCARTPKTTPPCCLPAASPSATRRSRSCRWLAASTPHGQHRSGHRRRHRGCSEQVSRPLDTTISTRSYRAPSSRPLRGIIRLGCGRVSSRRGGFLRRRAPLPSPSGLFFGPLKTAIGCVGFFYGFGLIRLAELQPRN